MRTTSGSSCDDVIPPKPHVLARMPLVLLTSTALMMEPAAMAWAVAHEANTVACVYFMNVVRIAAIILTAQFIKRLGVGWQGIGLTRPTWVDLGVVVLVVGSAAACLCAVYSVDTVVSMVRLRQDLFIDRLLDDPHYESVAFILIVFLGPIHEEIVYRGVVIAGSRLNRSSAASVAMSSLAFGLTHVDGGARHALWASLWGLSLSIIFIRRRNLWPLIVGHALWNFSSRAFRP